MLYNLILYVYFIFTASESQNEEQILTVFEDLKYAKEIELFQNVFMICNISDQIKNDLQNIPYRLLLPRKMPSRFKVSESLPPKEIDEQMGSLIKYISNVILILNYKQMEYLRGSEYVYVKKFLTKFKGDLKDVNLDELKENLANLISNCSNKDNFEYVELLNDPNALLNNKISQNAFIINHISRKKSVKAETPQPRTRNTQCKYFTGNGSSESENEGYDEAD